MELLLIGDEQQDMVEKYIYQCDLFALYEEDTLMAVCAVVWHDHATIEVKNIAVYEQYRRRGFGRYLLEFVCHHYSDSARTLLVGTGESPATLPFYKRCGFTYSHRIPEFFTDHYDHPIFEDGVQLRDMVYLKKEI